MLKEVIAKKRILLQLLNIKGDLGHVFQRLNFLLPANSERSSNIIPTCYVCGRFNVMKNVGLRLRTLHRYTVMVGIVVGRLENQPLHTFVAAFIQACRPYLWLAGSQLLY